MGTLNILAKEYLSKYPTMPSRTVARKMVEENKDVEGRECFTLNAARMAVLYLRGRKGDVNRKKIGMMVEMPPTDDREWIPYVVPAEYNNTLFMADLHIPYHDREAIRLFIKMARERKVDSVLINGDLMDFYELSTFCKDPRKRSFLSEVKLGNWFLDYLEDELPGAKIIFKKANHEYRFDRYITQRCPELYGMDGLNLASQFGINERGITLVSDKRIVKYGHLSILHGDELGKSVFSPVNPARGLYLRTHTTAFVSHYHTPSSHTEPDLNGTQTTTWSGGCLCGLHPEWMPINRWCLGAAFCVKDESGNFELENYKVIKGKVCPT